MTWTVVALVAVCGLIALVALSMVCNAAQNIHIARAIGRDPRNDLQAVREAQAQVRKAQP